MREVLVQADLTSGQNRNMYMIGLLALIVHVDWAKIARFPGLLESHAHSVIDSTLFKPVKGALKTHDYHNGRSRENCY